MKKSQISFEYLIVMGFIVLTITGILAVAFFYSNTVRDKIKDTQLNNCVGKIIATAESIFYSGKPSKATTGCYLPSEVKLINVTENGILVSMQTASGISTQEFSSNVELDPKVLAYNGGFKRVLIEANDTKVHINSV